MNDASSLFYNRYLVTPASRGLRCAFTGHRPQKLPFGFDEEDERCRDFKRRLRETLVELIGKGYTHFLSGGALGMDMWAAEAVLELKGDCPCLLLEMVSPFDGQARRWDTLSRERHERLFALADIVTATGHHFSPYCMHRRNRYLADNADLLLAAYDGTPGGTAETVAMARALGVPVRILPPVERELPLLENLKSGQSGSI